MIRGLNRYGAMGTEDQTEQDEKTELAKIQEEAGNKACPDLRKERKAPNGCQWEAEVPHEEHQDT